MREEEIVEEGERLDASSTFLIWIGMGADLSVSSPKGGECLAGGGAGGK